MSTCVHVSSEELNAALSGCDQQSVAVIIRLVITDFPLGCRSLFSFSLFYFFSLPALCQL